MLERELDLQLYASTKLFKNVDGSVQLGNTVHKDHIFEVGGSSKLKIVDFVESP